jgi:S1-C subfamily serine protease
MVAAQDDVNPVRPYLGIGMSPSDDGVEVTEVAPDSPAAAAGLEIGDIIQSINDEAVTADSIRQMLANLAVGDEINLSVQRGDETLELNATLVARPELAAPEGFQMPQFAERPMVGVRLENTDNGVVIREVVADSPAEEAGLQVDDVITKIGDQEVANAREAAEAIQAMQVGDVVQVEVQRGDETRTVDVTLGSSPTPLAQALPFGRDFLGFEYNANEQTWTIRNLSEDSPLYTAGLREGDVIQQFDGTAYDPASLREYLATLADDATVSVTVERDGATQDISVDASALSEINAFSFGDGNFEFFGPQGQGFNMPFDMSQLGGGGRLGVQFVSLDEQVAQERNITLTDGALVTQVADESPAADAGLQVDDVITAVNDEPVDAEHSLRDRLAAYEPADVVTLAVTRGDETLTIEATLGEPDFLDRVPFFGQDGREFPFPFEMPQPEQPQAPMSNL